MQLCTEDEGLRLQQSRCHSAHITLQSTQGCNADVHPQVARCLPWVVNNYKLEEITTVQELRRNVAKLFKLNANLRNPGVSTMSTRSCKLCTFKEYGSVWC